MQQAQKKKPGDMLMGRRWTRSPFTGFSVIDDQALIMLIGLPGESFPGTTLRLSFAGRTEAKQPDHSGADRVRIILPFFFILLPFQALQAFPTGAPTFSLPSGRPRLLRCCPAKGI